MLSRTRQSAIPFPATKNGVRQREKTLGSCSIKQLKTGDNENLSSCSDQTTPKKSTTDNPATPSTVLARLSLSSPKCVNEKSQYLLSKISSELPCREDEIQTLYQFLSQCIVDKKSGSIYVSGLPGTGKTATLTRLIALQEISDECQIVMANCTSVRSAHAIYTRISSSLNLKLRTKTEKAVASALEKAFTRTSLSQKMIILVLDEIDQLTSKFQTVLYKIFEWPSKSHSRLILVGIANAVDLTDRVLPRLRSLELQPRLLHFKPYTKEQIVKILRHRLSENENSSNFGVGSLELISAKVAGQSGDLRRALDLGRRVLEISKINSDRKKEISAGSNSSVNSLAKEQTEETALGLVPIKLGILNTPTRSSPRKRLAVNEVTEEEIPVKTPKKSMSNEKENASYAKSPRALGVTMERTPCKPVLSTNLPRHSPVLRITPRRLILMNDEDCGVIKSPRKCLFKKDVDEPVSNNDSATIMSQLSPRRSPRKQAASRTPVKDSPAKVIAINARDVLSVMNEMCPSARRLRTDQSAFPLHQKLLICTLMLILTKGKNRDVNIGKLYEVYGRVCRCRSITAVDLSEFISVCRQVEMAGALEIGKGPGKLAKVTLQWDETEVTHALKDTALLTAILSDTQVLNPRKK